MSAPGGAATGTARVTAAATMPDPSSLRATTVPLGEGWTVDPVAFGADDGHVFDSPALSLAARGVAAELSLGRGLAEVGVLREVQHWLSAVPSDGPAGVPGAGVVAFGALPFDGTDRARLIVPKVTYCRDEAGRKWVTVVSGAAEPATIDEALRNELVASPTPVDHGGPLPAAGEAGRRVELVATPSPDEFRVAVARAVEDIGAGRLVKVVLGRRIDLRLAAPIVASVALRRLHGREPACTAFSYPVDGGRFLGASPELLVARRAGMARCHPLAGTVALTGNPDDDRAAVAGLLASAKDQWEHDLVVREIISGLRGAGADVAETGPPSVVALRSVAHLATEVVGAFPGSAPGALELLATLHPTPAVCGVPRDVAMTRIGALEPVPRQNWAGPVGWVDREGNGDWMIGIRSATVLGTHARLWAGAGVVAGSDPDAELAETTVKLVPVADALLPGADVELLGSARLADELLDR